MDEILVQIVLRGRYFLKVQAALKPFTCPLGIFVNRGSPVRWPNCPEPYYCQRFDI